jgi:UDP-3-O-[3-hydroxymyristoyl] N-acetylglucosamine deacetylase / 3-hydroxyacyl-[acyl-carrier-protein] dehydratase
MTRSQRTIRTPFEIEGIGLHEGKHVRVRVRPGRADGGVVFLRSDLPDAGPVPATIASLGEGSRRTVLRRGAAEVHTVEHLLAALLGLQIDNLEIELDGPELPSLDGSSLPWFEALARAGTVEGKSPRKTLVLEHPVSVELDGATLTAMPSDKPGLHLSYTLDYSGLGLAPQYVEAHVPGTDLGAEIAPARTFVFASEAEGLQKAGLGQGAHGGNTVVLDAHGRPVEGRLRFPDEPARHKLLDLMGDLYLLGAELQGRVVATKSGHRAHHELVKRLSAELEGQELTGRSSPASGMDIREITQLLPHRYPFLLVDRVLELEGYRRAVGIKNVTVNEPFFMGHFPDQPVMPGVLILEAMAQLAGTLLLRRMEYTGKLPVLWAIDKVKLRRSVVPGDQLRLEVEATKVRDTMGKVDAIAKVDQQIAAEAQLTFTLVDAG